MFNNEDGRYFISFWKHYNIYKKIFHLAIRDNVKLTAFQNLNYVAEHSFILNSGHLEVFFYILNVPQLKGFQIKTI